MYRKMKHLIIVGARGWGREVYASTLVCPAYLKKEFDIKGFLDSKLSAFDGLNGNYPPILCSPEEYEVQMDDVFFVAMGASEWRKYYVDLITAKGGKFQTIICEGNCVNPTACIGEGSFISGWSCVSDNVHIGKHCIVHPFSNIGHNVYIGNFVTIEAFSFLGGYSEIGDESVMHVRSTLLRQKKIGKMAEVGAHSVVIRNVKDGEHVFGNPAKKIVY